MREKGMKLEDIGDIVSRDERTITRWIKEWYEVRMASIFTGHQGNENASKLTQEQRQEIKDTLGKPPCDEGLPIAFWDVLGLKDYVKSKFNTVYPTLSRVTPINF